MKILIFLLLLGYCWAQVLPNGCPSDFSVHRLLPHETDCTRFYQCSNGNRFEMRCGPGTAFDVNLQVCDWARDINCNPATTTTSSTSISTTTTAPNTTTTIPPNTTTPITNSTTPITTTTVLPPNPTTTPEITNPNTTTSTSTTTPNPPTTALPPNQCPTEWEIMLRLPKDVDCDKYFNCSDGIKLLLNCPKKPTKMKNFEMVFRANYTRTFSK